MRKMCFVVFALALMTSFAAAQITDGNALQFYLQDATGGVQVFKSGSSAWYSSKGLELLPSVKTKKG